MYGAIRYWARVRIRECACVHLDRIEIVFLRDSSVSLCIESIA